MNKTNILVVDDEPDIRELLEITLNRMGLNTDSVATISLAKAALTEKQFSLCLTDMNLPDGNGLDLVKDIQQHYPDMPVAVISAYGSVDTAITALKLGAFDFVSKPIELERLRGLIHTALKVPAVDSDVAIAGETKLLGHSPAATLLREQVAKLARSQAPVYICGESGSGKELVARLIHANGPRAAKPFVAVNCGAIPTELMESEFFGHSKGSFTGAVADKLGLFQAADGGTLFLDEVADLPLDMQVKLLRAIQEKSIRAIGDNKEVSVDIRLLSATHKNLDLEVKNNRFRQDLYYRINVIELKVPSLRERREDIRIIGTQVVQKIDGARQRSLSEAAWEQLESHNFPGNIRELQNILERACALCESELIEAEDLGLDLSVDVNSELSSEFSSEIGAQPSIPPNAEHTNAIGNTNISSIAQQLPVDSPDAAQALGDQSFQPKPYSANSESLDDYLQQTERDIIERALQQTRWNKTAAAELLGISFRALRYKLKKLDIH